MRNQFKINIKLDFWTIGIAILLSIIGIIFIYSASHQLQSTKYLKQLINFFISIIAYLILANVNYQWYINKPILVYGAGIFMLLITLLLGSEINNTKSWIKLGFFNVQLSEFSKLSFIISFSLFINFYQQNIKKIYFVLVSFLFIIPYVLLILLQPDVGTVVVFMFIFFAMLFISGANALFIGMIIAIGLISILLSISTYYWVNFLQVDNFVVNLFHIPSNIVLLATIFLVFATIIFLIYKYLFVNKKLFIMSMIFLTLSFGLFSTNAMKIMLKDYHYKRFLVLLNPEVDPAGKGYNIIQSLIAIGAGKITGQSLTMGKQNRGNFLPAEDTDFIISLIGEEWGFLGVIFILLLYLLLIYKCLYIAYSAKDFTASLIATGITSMYIAHILINIFSAIGLFPVIGVPLPFISYGGSALLTNFAGLGIIFNIKLRRFAYN